MDPVVVYVPRCVQNGSESLGLKALEDLGLLMVQFKRLKRVLTDITDVTSSREGRDVITDSHSAAAVLGTTVQDLHERLSIALE
jgi:hypothetical protein